MADIRKTVGDLDTWGAFDGTEVMEVFPESEGKSYKKKVGTASERDIGTGNDDVPDTSQLNVRLGTTGNLGTAAERDVGTGNDDLPDISQLNELINIIESVTGNHTATAPTAIGRTTVIVDATTATITIPDGVPIGGEILVKKIDSTQGTITIARSGSDVFTRASLTSVTLNADGDFWLLQKVSATRWDLVDGVESGSNTNGIYKRSSDGSIEQRLAVFNISTYANASTLGTQTWTFPSVAVSGVAWHGGIHTASTANPPARDMHIRCTSTVHMTTAGFRAESVNSLFVDGDSVLTQVAMSGRWYA